MEHVIQKTKDYNKSEHSKNSSIDLSNNKETVKDSFHSHRDLRDDNVIEMSGENYESIVYIHQENRKGTKDTKENSSNSTKDTKESESSIKYDSLE